MTLSGFCGFIQKKEYYFMYIIPYVHYRLLYIIIYRAAKEQKKAAKATKKAVAPPKAKVVPKQKATKVTQKSAPRVGGKR